MECDVVGKESAVQSRLYGNVKFMSYLRSAALSCQSCEKKESLCLEMEDFTRPYFALPEVGTLK